LLLAHDLETSVKPVESLQDIARWSEVTESLARNDVERELRLLARLEGGEHRLRELVCRPGCLNGVPYICRKTIAFTKARKITELISMWIHQARPEWADKIRSYRAGYLPEERREIEEQLFSGRLQAVIATSALEVGIDVGGLDACIMVGYPGTVISTWQRAGRVGRAEAPSRVFLVAMPDALDQYWMKHPKKLFIHKPESLMVGVENEAIAGAHLCCAAAELPLDPVKYKEFYGDGLDVLMKHLAVNNDLLEGAETPQWFCMKKNPQRDVSIRNMGEGYQIVTVETGELIGTIDSHRAFRDCHPGAIYLHQGVQYVVKDLRWEEHRILVSEEPVDYYTQGNYEEETEILEEKLRRPLKPLDENGKVVGERSDLRWGRVRVTQRFINYETHRLTDGSIVSTTPLTLPPQIFETEALWWVLPAHFTRDAANKKLDFMGGLHAAEHASIGLMPLYVICDRWDLGGVSTPAHPQVPQPVIFIYDGCPGGVGLTRKAYDLMESLLSSVFEQVRETIQAGGLEQFVRIIETEAEGDVSTVDIAAALLKMQMEVGTELTAEKPSGEVEFGERGLDAHLGRVEANGVGGGIEIGFVRHAQ